MNLMFEALVVIWLIWRVGFNKIIYLLYCSVCVVIEDTSLSAASQCRAEISN